MDYFTCGSRGVGIRISQNISFNLISQYADSESRFLIIKCDIFGDRYTLINIYVPTSDVAFLHKIQKYLI